MGDIQQKGFTYIELLMVIGIIGVILSFGIVMNIDSVTRTSILQERDLVVSLLLASARAQALANVDDVSHGIHIDNTNHRYVFFKGNNYVEDATSNRITPFTSEHITITHSSGATDILFERLSGNVSAGAGTLIISGNGMEQRITITDVGQIDW